MSAEEEELPPGVHFQPDDDEIVELYLLPRCFGQETAVPGVIIEDDDATATVLPSTLLERHGRGGDDEAYFFEPVGSGDGGDGAARQDRRCGSRGTWVWQRRSDGVFPAAAAGEGEGRVSWSKCLLNLHWGRGKRSGSTGWVMHEYTLVTNPPCPSPVKLCHVAFTGHGQKRQRVPDDDGDDGRDGEKLARQAATPRRKRVAAATPSPSYVDQDFGASLAQDQEVQMIQNYDVPSSVTSFWDSDVAGSGQEPFLLDQPLEPAAAATTTTTTMLVDQEPGVPVAGNQEHLMSQSQDCYQEEFQNLHEGTEMQAYCALLASNAGSGQEPVGDYWQQLGDFLGSNEFPCLPSTTTPNAEAYCNEEHDVQAMAPPPPPEPDGFVLLPMEEESGTAEQELFSWPWGGSDAFCDVPKPENNHDDMVAARTPADDGCGGDWYFNGLVT